MMEPEKLDDFLDELQRQVDELNTKRCREFTGDVDLYV
jgi:hypothetical protein